MGLLLSLHLIKNENGSAYLFDRQELTSEQITSKLEKIILVQVEKIELTAEVKANDKLN